MWYLCHEHVYNLTVCLSIKKRILKMLNLGSKCTSESQFTSMAFSIRSWNLTPRIFLKDFNSRTWKISRKTLIAQAHYGELCDSPGLVSNDLSFKWLMISLYFTKNSNLRRNCRFAYVWNIFRLGYSRFFYVSLVCKRVSLHK